MAVDENLNGIPTGPPLPLPPPPPPPAPIGFTCALNPASLSKVGNDETNLVVDRRDIINKLSRIVTYVIPHQLNPQKQQHETDQQRLTQPNEDQKLQQIQETPAIIDENPNSASKSKMMPFSDPFHQEIEWFAEICMIHTTPVQQVGPSCGFAAIAVVGQLLTKKLPDIIASGDVRNSVAGMIDWARERNYTEIGEIFSTIHLISILTHHFECNVSLRVFSAVEEDSKLKENGIKESIVKHIEEGGVVLFPYDKGPNHEPVQRNGHSAHWCVILGVVRLLRKANVFSSSSENSVEEIFVICRHGVSAKHAIWHLRDLIKSNLALQEFNPNRLESETKYVVSDFNDLKDLRGTSVFVKINQKSENVIWRCDGNLNELISQFCQ